MAQLEEHIHANARGIGWSVTGDEAGKVDQVSLLEVTFSSSTKARHQ
jgi:hypothetical protein